MSQAGMLAFPFGEYRDTEQVLLAQCQREVYAKSERIEQFTDRTNSGYERLLYVHEDLQGNTRYYTKDNGQSFAELTYDAWGMPESPNKLLNNDHGNYVYATYTGHIFDTTLDIYFAEARFYDAQTRQWLAMDPIKDGGNWYQYCYSNPLRYWDPLGLSGFTVFSCYDPKVIGSHAHKTLQDYFLNTFLPTINGWGWKEFPVYNYFYNASGRGQIDILLYVNEFYEVYEIKPVSQRFANIDFFLKIKEESDRHLLNQGKKVTPIARQQRQGYIDSLEIEGYIVDRYGTSFNPNHLMLLDIYDSTRVFEYVTNYENQPGMIYYKTYNVVDENVAEMMVKANNEGKSDEEIYREVAEYYLQKQNKAAMEGSFSTPLDNLYTLPVPPVGVLGF